MDVVGLGASTDFKNLPAGALFLGNRSSGKEPLVCIKTAPLKREGDEYCVILFPPDREAEGPALVSFPDWFGSRNVLHLAQVGLVLGIGPNVRSTMARTAAGSTGPTTTRATKIGSAMSQPTENRGDNRSRCYAMHFTKMIAAATLQPLIYGVICFSS